MSIPLAVQDSVARALRTRHQIGLGLLEPVNPFDAASALGIEVKFSKQPSTDGLFVRLPKPTIIISALRPFPRQTFTCAHEIGHLVLNHEPMVDLDLSEGFGEVESEDDEKLA